MRDIIQVESGLIKSSFHFGIIFLLDPQCIFHIVDYLVCGVKLFERVLVGQFLATDLFS